MEISTKIGIVMVVWFVFMVVFAQVGTNDEGRGTAKFFTATFLSIAVYLLL